VEVRLHTFLNSTLDGHEWSASDPGRFIPGKDSLVPSEQEMWVSPKASADILEERTSLAPASISTQTT